MSRLGRKDRTRGQDRMSGPAADRPEVALRPSGSSPIYTARRGWGFVTPALATLVLVLGFPIVVAMGTSLLHPDGGLTLENYARVATDPQFASSLVVTFVFVGGTVGLHLLLGGAVAFALHHQLRARRLWRVMMILPWTMPDVISGLVWRFMYEPTAGVINAVLRDVGLMGGYVEWLGQPELALPSVIMADVWRGYPFVMIILLAGLQSTRRDLSDAAKADGARWWQEWWYVTMPQLRRVVLVAVALDTIWQFRRFGLVFNITGGGPGDATEILSLYIYKVYFRFFEYEYASAVAVTLAAIMLVLSLPYIRAAMGRNR